MDSFRYMLEHLSAQYDLEKGERRQLTARSTLGFNSALIKLPYNMETHPASQEDARGSKAPCVLILAPDLTSAFTSGMTRKPSVPGVLIYHLQSFLPHVYYERKLY